MINPRWLESASDLHEQFDQAQPFRHLVLDEFFTDEFCQQLVERFPPFDTRLAMNENGEIGGKCVHERLDDLGGPFAQIDDLIQTDEFLEWLGTVAGIDRLLYDPDYFGGGTHENRHGQDLDPHVDFNKHPKTGWHRRLNLIVYLNREWSEDWGGAIEFHSDPRLPREENEITTVQPALNRAVLFETTYWSWHGFERIDLPQGDEDSRSRKSVALYFYSEDRPEEEKTKPHSTIYVERPLPAEIQPGTLLGEEEYQTVVRLLTRRDQHLQRLYHNISELSAEVEGLRHRVGQAEQSREDAPADSDLVSRGRRWLARRIWP
jgi:hypothetical protein